MVQIEDKKRDWKDIDKTQDKIKEKIIWYYDDSIRLIKRWEWETLEFIDYKCSSLDNLLMSI